MKTLAQTVVNGNKVRIVEKRSEYDGDVMLYQAQTKRRGDRYFDDYGPECETNDHAYYWAFEAIRCWFDDVIIDSQNGG